MFEDKVRLFFLSQIFACKFLILQSQKMVFTGIQVQLHNNLKTLSKVVVVVDK